jgi:hypothetical protein
VRGRVIAGAAISVASAVAAALVFPTRLETVVVGWASAILVWAAVEYSVAVRQLMPSSRSLFESVLERPGRNHARPADLERCERMLSWRRYSSRDFDHHLRPVLLGLLRHRLTLSSAPLNPELIALLEGTPAEQTYGKGVSTVDLERIVLTIESL